MNQSFTLTKIIKNLIEDSFDNNLVAIIWFVLKHFNKLFSN